MIGGPNALTLRESAAVLAVSEKTIQRLIDRAQLAAFKVGSQWRVLPSALKTYMDAQTAETEARVGTPAERIDSQ